jgi:hypothetical protein
MADDFGTDFAGVEDIDANWTFLGDGNSIVALTHALARRYMTPRGGLFYDQSYGLDLRSFISETYNPSTVETMIAAEARKDERVDDATATIAVTGHGPEKTWRVSIVGQTTSGEAFSLVLAVSSVTVALLNEGA